MEEKRGGRENEEHGGGIGEAALGDGVEDGEEGEEQGGQEQGQQDTQEEAGLAAYPPYQGHLIWGGRHLFQESHTLLVDKRQWKRIHLNCTTWYISGYSLLFSETCYLQNYKISSLIAKYFLLHFSTK